MKLSLIAALFSLASVKGYDDASFKEWGTKGKFFYTEVLYNEFNAQHYYIEAGIGCDSFPQKWVITTEEQTAGYVTSICGKSQKCDVPNRFTWQNSNADPPTENDKCVKLNGTQLFIENARLNDGEDNAIADPIPEFQLQGYHTLNKFNFTYLPYRRQTVMEIGSFAIMQSNKLVFSSNDYSGYLGVGPYAGWVQGLSKLENENLVQNSVLYQLKNKKLTDNTVVSFYLNKKGTSVIKFGTYDKLGLKDPNDFTILRTIDEKRWMVKGSQSSVMGKSLQELAAPIIKFLLQPQLAMLYIPEGDYNRFKAIAEQIFKTEITCSSSTIPCYFKSKCDGNIPSADISFKMRLSDTNGGKRDIEIPKKDLLINGAALGKGDICMLGVYKYPTDYSDQNAYYGGSLFMQDYYVALTMDPWEKGNNETDKYLLMGIGPKNPDVDLGKMQYDSSYSKYDPQPEKLDISTLIWGADPYSQKNQMEGWIQKNMVLFIILIVGCVFAMTSIVCCIYFRRKNNGQYRLAKNSFTSNAHKGYAGIQNKSDANNAHEYDNEDSSMDRTMSNQLGGRIDN